MNDILKQIQNEMSYSNLEQLEQAEHYDSLDAEDFNSMDDAEYAEYLDYLDDLEDAEHKKHHKKGHPLRIHRKHAKKHGKVKAHAAPLKGRAKLAAIGSGKSYADPKVPTSSRAPQFGSKGYIAHLMTTSVGDLNITVQRMSANIPLSLPYILFDLQGFSSAFISTIKSFMPAGVIMTVGVDAATGNLVLTYTQGILVDTIVISLTGGNISYNEFLQSMNQNYFKSMYIRYELPNDANLLLQCSQQINFGLLSSLGMQNKNQLLPRSRRMNDDYQTFIINLFLPTQSITSEFSFVQSMIPVANYVAAWDIFMSERVNINNAV